MDGPVACFALYDGIQLWCNRDGLFAGLRGFSSDIEHCMFWLGSTSCTADPSH